MHKNHAGVRGHEGTLGEKETLMAQHLLLQPVAFMGPKTESQKHFWVQIGRYFCLDRSSWGNFSDWVVTSFIP